MTENPLPTQNSDKTQVSEKSKQTKAIVKKILSIFSYALLGIAILLLVVILYQRIRGESPKVFGYSFYIVASDSMYPELIKGDLVIAKKCAVSDIEIGDDIVFYTDDPHNIAIGVTIIVHRVVGINDDGDFITKGINNSTEDEYPAKKVIGKKVGSSRFIGKIITFLTRGYNVFYMAVLIVLIIVGYYAIKQIVLASKKPR